VAQSIEQNFGSREQFASIRVAEPAVPLFRLPPKLCGGGIVLLLFFDADITNGGAHSPASEEEG